LIEPSATNVDDLSVRRSEAAADIVVTPKAHGITGNDLAIGQRPKGCRCVTDITQQAKGNPSHLDEMAQQHAAHFDARSELSRQACEPADARIDEDNDTSLGNCKHDAIPLAERTIYVAAEWNRPRFSFVICDLVEAKSKLREIDAQRAVLAPTSSALGMAQ
jgi:hypothetical protein